MAVSYTHLDVYKRQEQPCALLLDFPLAFTDVLPHQLDDEELGPIINKLKEGNVQAPYFLPRASYVAEKEKDESLKSCCLAS